MQFDFTPLNSPWQVESRMEGPTTRNPATAAKDIRAPRTMPGEWMERNWGGGEW